MSFQSPGRVVSSSSGMISSTGKSYRSFSATRLSNSFSIASPVTSTTRSLFSQLPSFIWGIRPFKLVLRNTSRRRCSPAPKSLTFLISFQSSTQYFRIFLLESSSTSQADSQSGSDKIARAASLDVPKPKASSASRASNTSLGMVTLKETCFCNN